MSHKSLCPSSSKVCSGNCSAGTDRRTLFIDPPQKFEIKLICLGILFLQLAEKSAVYLLPLFSELETGECTCQCAFLLLPNDCWKLWFEYVLLVIQHLIAFEHSHDIYHVGSTTVLRMGSWFKVMRTRDGIGVTNKDLSPNGLCLGMGMPDSGSSRAQFHWLVIGSDIAFVWGVLKLLLSCCFVVILEKVIQGWAEEKPQNQFILFEKPLPVH